MILLFLFGVFLMGAQAETLVVDQSGSGDYSTIGKAVNAAKTGDEILVRPGYYKEGAIPIRLPISIAGDQGSVTLEGGLWWWRPALPSPALRSGALEGAPEREPASS